MNKNPPPSLSGSLYRLYPCGTFRITIAQTAISAVAMQRHQSELHSLLSHAFEGWGSEDYFTWKYTQYPNYEPSTDNFTIRNDAGRIVAARRVFRHHVQTPLRDRLSVHIHGGTAVHEAYRGRGYYTTLLSESTAMSEREADSILTFNRAGKITTKHHKKNGWNWIRLPIFASVISPSRVYSYYLTDNQLLGRLADHVSVVDRQLTEHDLVTESMATLASKLYGDPQQGSSTNDTNGEKPHSGAVTNGSGHTDNSNSHPEYEIHRHDGPISETVLEELHTKLQTQLTDYYHFERSTEKLKHCLLYPASTTFVARHAETGDVLDFVVAGTLDKDGLIECRVLEQTWSHPALTRQLFRAVEAHGRTSGADVIVASTATPPGSHWISLGTEYMMWPPSTDGPQLPTDPSAWRVTMCDIL